ncbi:hypothetical protein Syun_009393 [Stephania yunnanensis]|uniref:Uncharacterized protein n=1 Tax=Stephania yunnanensis TaxID=152371 RepID=A0AAP0KGA6_9MAGN
MSRTSGGGGQIGESAPPHKRKFHPITPFEKALLKALLNQADSSETPPTVNDLYLHLHTVNHDRMTFIDTRSERFYDRLQNVRQELTQTTPEQSVDDEAVYPNVAGESSKGRVYGLGSVGRKKRRYGAPGASTSQTPDVVPRASSMSLRSNYESSLECYDEESGRIDGERHLHAIANEFGKSIKARFSDSGLGGRLGGYSGGNELGGGYGGFGGSGLGAYRGESSLGYSILATESLPFNNTVDDLREKMADIDNHVGEETGPKEGDD